MAFGKLFKTQYDWDYSTAPEPFCDRRRLYLPRGRTLGGSSSMNAMIYMRGNRADYDDWAAGGATGWGYDDVLPYFKRAEDNERGASEYHGAGGPLTVSESRSRNEMSLAFVAAAKAAGYAENPDFNGAEQEGFGVYQLTQRGGRRCSAAVAYLHPALERPNLHVETRVQAHRVLFDGTRAVGVAGERFGEPVEYRAHGEVIVSAGAYNSPQLLMLSGIGPAEHLHDARDRAARRSAGRPEPPGPPDRRRLVDDDPPGQPARRRAAAHRRAAPRGLRAERQRPADVEHRRERRLPAHALRSRGTRHPVPRRAGDVRRRGPLATRPTTASPRRRACSSRRAAGA